MMDKTAVRFLKKGRDISDLSKINEKCNIKTHYEVNVRCFFSILFGEDLTLSNENLYSF